MSYMHNLHQNRFPTRSPEEQLLHDIFEYQDDEDNTLQTEEYIRKSFPVDAVQITADNMEEVAKWCDGDIRKTDKGDPFIKVRVHNPLTERQTKGYVGDWVLYAGKGYKVYTQKAFDQSFSRPETLRAEGNKPAPFDAVGFGGTSGSEATDVPAVNGDKGSGEGVGVAYNSENPPFINGG